MRAADHVSPLLRALDPEKAHAIAIWALKNGLAGRNSEPDPPSLAIKTLGLSFRNPIGLAAGFDKNAEAVQPLMRLGFGFVEAGTVTLRPQPGNPKPRLFRLPQYRAIINRLGFNNLGIDAYVAQLKALTERPAHLGANIGINKQGADPERDYPALVAAVTPYADYVTINVSSPNTPGLRDLQEESRLRAILAAVTTSVPVRPPILVKIAPDLAEGGVASVVETCANNDVAGLIISNTTLARPSGFAGLNVHQVGGLSGAPLFERSTAMLRLAHRLAGGRLTLIGCGGIRTGADILAKLQAGASLVQIYTEFAYAGPGLIPRLKRELLDALRQAGFATAMQAIGTAKP